MLNVDFADLETRGFVLVRAFLSDAELREYRIDFDRQPVDAANRNYRMVPASVEANARIRIRVEEVLERVREQTGLRPDAPQAASYFATGAKGGVRFSWHQDHESFFELQNHYDYLNFYIPIVKPLREKSNLCIVPFDVLERDSPATYRRVARGGAARFVRMGGLQLIVCDDAGTVHRMRGDLEHLAHTPMLDAGDLLLLRGDMIHRTQDADTDRVALSYRVYRAQSPISRRRLAAGGLMKAIMMANNSERYERMFKAFDLAGRTEIGAAELMQALDRMPPVNSCGPRQFLRYLMVQKLKSGVLGRFVMSVSAMYALAGAGSLINLYYRYARPLVRPAARSEPS
ncbi:MAG: hypothetical protein IT176_04560 [Acidobacteria bacterium]|nr:hypothetical protein [Acidobacteriota bacterium]